MSATARKFLRGPRGIGFLYVSDRALSRGDAPLLIDMRGASWVAADSYRLEDDARRFENWEFAYSLVLGLGEAARYALDVGVAEGDVLLVVPVEVGAGIEAWVASRIRSICPGSLSNSSRISSTAERSSGSVKWAYASSGTVLPERRRADSSRRSP